MCGVLVCPCLHLHVGEVAKAGIGRLIEKATELGLQSFHGIVMSLEHVILVRSVAGNRVEHTRPLELISYPYDYEEDRGETEPSCQGDSNDWRIDNDHETDAFAAIAHVFEAVELER
jgi:hypothetical protein